MYIKLCHGFFLLSNYAVQVVALGWHCKKLPGLGTAFFYVLNASFFCVLLKHSMFFYVFFQFLATYETQKNGAFFCVLLRSFLKNIKERRECFVLLQRT